MAAETVVLKIDSEATAASALRRLLDGEFDSASVKLDFSQADWLSFHIVLKGEIFHQTLTSSTMRGFTDFQTALHRSVALILHDSAKVSALTKDEEAKFELIFKVGEGSSDVFATAKDMVAELASKALDKMSGRVILGAILVLAIGYFGTEAYKAHLSTEVDISKVETDLKKSSLEKERQEDITKLATVIAERQGESGKAIADAIATSDKLAKIIEERDRAFDSIVKGADRTDGIELQGIGIPGPVVEELNRSSRTRGRDVTLETMFRVVAVDSSSFGTFTVKLRRESDGLMITATLENSPRAERYHRVVQRAEWKKMPVRVKVKARKFSDEDFRDAQIVSAITPRG